MGSERLKRADSVVEQLMAVLWDALKEQYYALDEVRPDQVVRLSFYGLLMKAWRDAGAPRPGVPPDITEASKDLLKDIAFHLCYDQETSVDPEELAAAMAMEVQRKTVASLDDTQPMVDLEHRLAWAERRLETSNRDLNSLSNGTHVRLMGAVRECQEDLVAATRSWLEGRKLLKPIDDPAREAKLELLRTEMEPPAAEAVAVEADAPLDIYQRLPLQAVQVQRGQRLPSAESLAPPSISSDWPARPESPPESSLAGQTLSGRTELGWTTLPHIPGAAPFAPSEIELEADSTVPNLWRLKFPDGRVLTINNPQLPGNPVWLAAPAPAPDGGDNGS